MSISYGNKNIQTANMSILLIIESNFKPRSFENFRQESMSRKKIDIPLVLRFQKYILVYVK